MADPLQWPSAELSGNLGNTKEEAGSKSLDQHKNEHVPKEASWCPASSVVHPPACNKGQKRKVEHNDGLSDSGVALRRSSRCLGQVRGSRYNSSTITTGGEKLDSKTFHRYFMHIWDDFPEDKVKSFTYLDPLWFDMFADENRSASVLSWIKKKGIFLKRYVFVPIVKWSHWSLLIFCNLGESLDSKTNAPCMLLLDSSQSKGSTQLEPLIRRFLVGIYKSEERTESQKQLIKMPLLIPKVPQQKKGDKCGFYVLYYMHLFVERAPETFSISTQYPNLMGKNWFTEEQVESFSKTLYDLPAVVSDHDHASNDSSDSIQVSVTPFCL